MRDSIPCETCRISSDRVRFGPCAMCVEHRVRVRVGDARCGLCGRALSRFVLVRKADQSMTVGTLCALKAIEGGWVEE